APFRVHLLALGDGTVVAEAEQVYKTLEAAGVEVLFDDRDTNPGEKFGDADLIGIPTRLIVSQKTMAAERIEYDNRLTDNEAELLTLSEVHNRLAS
ncbi:MAG: His/Gly/Thr/Pro-type tRNA ligase C-terminal domain-containing protein, partial [Candidatus Paceibacterota bacterium]